MLGELQNQEISKNIYSIAAEKKLDPLRIFAIFEEALRESLTRVYGMAKLAVSVDHNAGAITVMECSKVIADEDYNPELPKIYEERIATNDEEEEEKLFHYNAISLSDAQKIDPEAQIDSMINIVIPNAWANIKKTKDLIKTFNRAFRHSLNVLVREQEYAFFLKKEYTALNATVKRFTKDGYILSYDNYEFLLPSYISVTGKKQEDEDDKFHKTSLHSETILDERFRIDDMVHVYIKSVSNDKFTRYQVLGSRTHPDFLGELLKHNVPEIRDEQILIYAIERIPGLRSKVVVHSTDTSLDPVGACIGVRGTRIKTISQELGGEKIDIIQHSSDIAQLIQNAMHPIKPLRVLVDENDNKVVITVLDKDLSGAIGKRGANTKLISRLVRCRVAMVSETMDTTQRLSDFKKLAEGFMVALDVEEIIAQLLVSSGFKSLEAIAKSEISELMKIEYFNEELAQEIKIRAQEYEDTIYERKIAGVDKEYIEFIKSHIEDNEFLLKMIDGNIRNLKDFADLASDEVIDIIGKFEINEEKIGEVIIDARKKIGLID